MNRAGVPAGRMIVQHPGRAWPNQITSGTDPVVRLRPLRRSDGRAWRAVRQQEPAWFSRWDATTPPGGEVRPSTFPAMVRQFRVAARRGSTLPFALEVDGRFAGQVTVNNIVRGSAQFGSIGYWLGKEYAGREIMPRAVAMVVDHSFFHAGLHRLEICIRPENSNSLRVVEKLGIAEIGFAPRFLHIDGEWRDHRIFAITTEEVPRGLLARWEDSRNR